MKKSLSGKNPWLKQIRLYVDCKEFSPDMLSALVEKILVYQMEDGIQVEIQFRYAADRELLMDAAKELGGGAS